jgi:hypothetical protein
LHDKEQHRHDVTRATARLPELEIEILHRWLPGGEGEQLSINLTAMPSFEAFSWAIESGNPFTLWAQAVMVWLHWFGGARSLMLPWSSSSILSKK